MVLGLVAGINTGLAATTIELPCTYRDFVFSGYTCYEQFKEPFYTYIVGGLYKVYNGKKTVIVPEGGVCRVWRGGNFSCQAVQQPDGSYLVGYHYHTAGGGVYDCDATIPVRFLLQGHPDFDNGLQRWETGLVLDNLSSDGNPIFNSAKPSWSGSISGAESFDQWYRDIPGVNLTFNDKLILTQDPRNPRIYTYSNGAFFPLAGKGAEDAYSFTTEIHTHFLFKGDETFTFEGDDDVWVFINKKLAIDLGGVHGVLRATVNLADTATRDKLGITPGKNYDLAVFHAERQRSKSHFTIQTTMALGEPRSKSVILSAIAKPKDAYKAWFTDSEPASIAVDVLD